MLEQLVSNSDSEQLDKALQELVRPSHYQGEIETIDYIKDKLTPEGYEGFLAGNVIKYISRYRLKNGVVDLEKSNYYLGELKRHKREEHAKTVDK